MELVTKSEAARRLGKSHAAITKYVARGLPVETSGKLDWDKTQVWLARHNVPERSGSFRARASKQTPDAPITPEFIRGFVAARAGLRKHLPNLIGAMRPDGVEDRIATFTIADCLLEKWLDDPVNTAVNLPGIDWKAFSDGITPKRAEGLYEALHSDFREGGAHGE